MTTDSERKDKVAKKEQDKLIDEINTNFGNEKQLCPRRMEGPVFIKEECDLWETNRWGVRESDKWPDGFDKPRTCSYCGCVNPDDAIKLIEKGWEIEPSDKRYKWYLHPPGKMLHHKRVMNAIGDTEKEKEAFNTPYVNPTPPVKLYGQHVSQEKLAVLNKLWEKQKSTTDIF